MKHLDKINPFMNLAAITAFNKHHGDLANKLKNVIHVAGTNGKGSTVAFLRAILEASGFSVNVFTSPHLVRVNERIRIKGKLISNSYSKKLDKIIEQDVFGKKLSIFEKFVAKALIAFTEHEADFTILEVGLGGRLDATNIIKYPLVSIITPIDFDHEHILGNTKSEIAKEKAAIIKKVSLVVSAYQSAEVNRVLQKVANNKQARLITGGVDWYISNSIKPSFNTTKAVVNLKAVSSVASKDGTIRNKVSSSGKKSNWLIFNSFAIKLQKLALNGEHQLYNAALAIVALKAALRGKITKVNIRKGLKKVNWPGRMQVINSNCLYGYTFNSKTKIILDGAHNPHGARVLLDYIKQNVVNRKVYIVLAMLKTKNITKYLVEFKQTANLKLYGVNLAKEFNAYSAKEIANIANKLGITATAKISAKQALVDIKATKGDKLIIICGSLYLIGKVLLDNKIIPE